MIVLADESLETFFDHEFAQTFKLTEKATEQQRSLGREIFDNLLATGTKLATSTGVRPQLKNTKSTEVSISTPELEATIDAIQETRLEEKLKIEEEVIVPPKKEEHVLGDVSEDDDDDDDEGDLSPDVLEEVDRLLKEYGDEDD